jgi:hypothetical protein
MLNKVICKSDNAMNKQIVNWTESNEKRERERTIYLRNETIKQIFFSSLSLGRILGIPTIQICSKQSTVRISDTDL